MADSPFFPPLPPGPLIAVLERLEATYPMESACERAGISDRTYREWRQGRRKTAKFNTADTILTKLGLFWWEVWTAQNTTPEGLADVAYAFTGERPGEGEQLELAA